ncbi:AIPR family protein [Streptomyces sp. NPDC058369]|uniref:Abortive phage resistance protein n=1 Tax=Streptomyces sp. gb1(2016) TaxID=1828321 RepID=A0A652L9P7_9ACTN|nr:AIPR family protein [Streptomyces sp. gb1(2016)]TXS32394.1 abortive phage resistance protein [Streptomyces sp. gb1(2016)]
MADLALHDYVRTLMNDVQSLAETENASIPTTFTRRVLEQLEEAGVVANTHVAFHQEHGVVIYGFGVSEDRSTLDLYTTEYDLAQGQPGADKLTKSDTAKAYRRLLAFLRKCGNIRNNHAETTAVHELCEGVEKALTNVVKIRLFLFSNQVGTAGALPEPTELNGVAVTHELWDVTRLHRHETSGSLSEPIVVDFDPPLPCLSGESTEPNHSVTLAVLPGALLAELYEEHRTRLLELNVRAFLQLRTGVNRGMRTTLLTEPARFLAYNNGITATASEADFVVDADGNRVAIRRLTGIQVVNGGQTTATLHHVMKRDKRDLSGVKVQMKLSLVDPEHLEKIVPLISQYSNTQNKVTLVDFSSNHRFHVDFERVSRTLWAPATDDSGQETRWFYERARGQYAEEEAKHSTVAAKRKYRALHPTRQRFSKADLAKYMNSWNGVPYWVSRGAQKNFNFFMEQMKDTPPVVDVSYCQRVIAAGLLFKAVDAVAKEHDARSHKALVTTYTMAHLCSVTRQRIDLDRIWREQGVSAALVDAVHSLVPLVMEKIIAPGKHVTEWAKSSPCWDAVSDIRWVVPDALEAELLPVPVEFTEDTSKAEEQRLADVHAIGAEEWEALGEWARQTRNLEPSERQLATVVATRLRTGGDITATQTAQALLVHEAAMGIGFSPAAI